jgi:UDP-2,3-diacylglucosamine hydrolase
MSTPSPLPRLWEMRAPESWRCIDLVSDLHLSESMPATFDAFAAHLRSTDADAVLILGDLFEVWIGDDARYSGFEGRVCDVLAEAASRRTVGFMAGNRDFLVGGAMLKECGVMALADPTVAIAFSERVLLTHGDLLCIGDVDYQRFRRDVRSDDWQSEFLARPLAERRALARRMRDESDARKRGKPLDAWPDADIATAVRWMHEAGTHTLLHGHTHRPVSEALAPGFVRHVLSDWDLDTAHPARAEVLRWRRSGLSRVRPLARK